MSKKIKTSNKKPTFTTSKTSGVNHLNLSDLYQSEAWFRGFIENLPVMFYAAEPVPPYAPIYVSPAFERLGYPLEDWCGNSDTWVNAVHPDDRERVLQETKTAVSTSGETDYEYRLVAKDGKNFWVRDRGCFVRDEQGKAVCWQGVMVDITERKLAKMELERREHLYRTFTRNIPNMAVLLFDRDFRYTLAEGVQLAKHGFSREMFEGKTIFEVFPPEICEELAQYYHRALAGESVNFEMESEEGSFEINVVPVKNDDGEIFSGMVMWHDISIRKDAEIALKESEERYLNLFENANDLIYFHDLKGNYLSVNEATTKVFGYTREQALKMNIRQIIAPNHYKFARRMMKEKLTGARQTVYEVDCITKNGSRITLEVNSSLIYKNGVPTAVQGIARDVTERKSAEEALKEREESYRDLFENANDLIYTHDLTGNFTSLNRAGEVITGFARDEALQMNVSEIVAPDFLEAARQMTARKVAGETPTAYELEIINKSGNRVSLDLSTRLIFENGEPIGVQGIGRDVTERRKAEAKLKKSEESYRLLGESIMHQVWTAQPDGKLDYVNKNTIEYFGRDEEQLLREGWKYVLHPNDLAECLERWNYSLKTGEYYETEFRLLDRVGNYRWHLARANAGRDDDGNIVKWFGTNTDINDQKLAEAQLSHYACHDALTNLPNRVEFMSQLQQTINRAAGNDWSRFAVLFLDLDRFKVINDSLGHAIGDKLLVSIAEKLKSCVRPGDIVARLGGDEFTILLNRTGDIKDIVRVADRLQQKLSEPFKLDNYEVFTSASIGIIVSDGTPRKPEDFLRDADAAMYRAKESGKARYEIFDREMHVRNLNLLRLETDLRRAVERDEFEVFYQPIISLETGEVREFEALLRWRHPEHGLVAPNEFICVAEETGLIIPIGRWILEEACRQTVEWQNRFPHLDALTISVNLSAKQLMHPTLTAQVKDVLYKTNLKPQCLQLEVTESTVMEHHDTAHRVLNELNALGILLSTDDFGTGYSSLSYLHRFPFDRLKIDRSFISKMDSESKSGAIVRTILLLGQNLDIEVVAEGIENKDQLGQLQSLGCGFGQGFLFSKPVPKKEAEKLLLQGVKNFPSDASFVFGGNRKLIEISDVQ